MYSIEDYQDCVWTGFSLLERFMRDVFVKIGTSESDATIIADVLIAADKRGIVSVYLEPVHEFIELHNFGDGF